MKSNSEKCKAWYAKVKDTPEFKAKNRAKASAWRIANRDLALARDREAYQAIMATNPEKHRAQSRAWGKANRHKKSADWARYYAKKIKAMPKWANPFFIEEIYHLAQLRSKALGVPYHVDHIIPLRHPLVCGLHCEQNLQVIPGTANVRKGNTFCADQPQRR